MKRFWVGLLNGVLCLLVGMALGLAALLACDWLYRADVRLLNIAANSGLEETLILENYHAAVSYLVPWNDAQLELRGLTWSAAGREYFRQLRICVLCVYILGLSGGVGLVCLHGSRQRLGRKVWNVSGAVSLGLIAGLGVLLALDFARLQEWFCNTVFGESWQLYEDLDPIVTIFPQSYFVHGAFFILFVCVAGCLLQFAAGYTPAAPRQAPAGRLGGGQPAAGQPANRRSPAADTAPSRTAVGRGSAAPRPTAAQPRGSAAPSRTAPPSRTGTPEKQVYRRTR